MRNLNLKWLGLILVAISAFGSGAVRAGETGKTVQSLTGQTEVDRREKDRVCLAAEAYLHDEPVTITSFRSDRSAGGLHDFFSEGDYWWPDPKNPDGPYVQRDGMTNPDNFVAHREALYRFSIQVAALTAAYRLTSDNRFSSHAIRHLRAWFVIDSTRMLPHLKFGQAIRRKVTGRGIGIIDTIHLIEVARAVEVLRDSPDFPPVDADAVRRWFREYLTWLTTHQYGIEEREAKNNHGTWWLAQVAAFAHLVNDAALLDSCRYRFREVLLPGQMGEDGSFPLEIKRTRPYSYSLFNLEGYALICRILSTTGEDLWTYELPDGRGMQKAFRFMFPYIVDRNKWPHPADIMHGEQLPVRQSGFLFAGWALKNDDYVRLWSTLPSDLSTPELVRTFPIRQPHLWVP